MQCYQIVIDTNVFLSALRSNQGASFLLLTLIGGNSLFEINLSVPLVLEYEDVCKGDGSGRTTRKTIEPHFIIIVV